MIWGPNDTYTNVAPKSYSTSLNAPEIPIIRSYWLSFIRAYDPNVYRWPGSPTWERWSSDTAQRIMFQTNNTRMEAVPTDQRERCDYLASIGVDLQQ